MKNLISNKQKSNLAGLYTYICILFGILAVGALTYFIASKGLRTFFVHGVDIREFLFGTTWDPESYEGVSSFGAGAFIFGSFAVTFLAVLISTPLSLGAAVFMAEINPKYGRKFLQPVIELLVGIPSVVYGYVGLSLVVPFIRKYFSGLGFSLLAGMIVLAIMILPTITSVAYDSLVAIPKDLRLASYALGTTRWQTIKNVVIPAALPNVLTGVILGMARAFGEALAVQMVIGNVLRMPKSILDASSTLTSIITLEMGNTIAGSAYNEALWSMALILLIMSFVFIGVIRILGRRRSL
ncbi:MAG: phosphate ABC transporter permease subunit PstC [Tissierellales bacterium]|nr:phosphate ABC transporter permease subunit PstC [Tissierellales bacterium]